MLSFVIGGREVQIRFRNLDVIPEDLIEPNLQRIDPRPFSFALFHGGDNLFAVLAQVAELVQLAVIAAADHPGFGGQGRRIVGDGTLEPLADVGEFVELLVEMTKKLAAACGLRCEEILEHGKLRERFAQGHELAWGREAKCNAAGEALQVENAFELFADFAAHDGLLDKVRDRIEARIDRFPINQWTKHPGAQETRAHAGDRGVQRGDQRGGGSRASRFLGKDGRKQFEIADGHGVKDQSVVLFVVTDAVEMSEGFGGGGRTFVGGLAAVRTIGGVFAEIVHDDAGCCEGLQMIVEAEAGKFGDAELFAEDAFGIVALKNPIFEAGFHAAGAFEERGLRRFEELLGPGKQRFPRMKQLQLVAERFIGARAGEFRGLKFAGGEIDVREANGRARGVPGDGGEKIVFTGVEHGDIGRRAGRDHANDFASHQLFCF